MADWNVGRYELMAPDIAPVASEVIDAVEPVEGLKLLDLCCGTGNATLVAADRRAHAVGLDGAPRLLEVAADRARKAGHEIDWMEGDVHELPFPGESFDLITSVFGVIFAADPAVVAAEIGRVLKLQGRFAISTWVDEGPMAEMRQVWARAMESKQADGPGPEQHFDWGDPAAVTSLLAEHGLMARCVEGSLDFVAGSVDEEIAGRLQNNPLWLAAKPLLGEREYAATVKACREILNAANRDPEGFRISARYLIASGSPV